MKFPSGNWRQFVWQILAVSGNDQHLGNDGIDDGSNEIVSNNIYVKQQDMSFVYN